MDLGGLALKHSKIPINPLNLITVSSTVLNFSHKSDHFLQCSSNFYSPYVQNGLKMISAIFHQFSEVLQALLFSHIQLSCGHWVSSLGVMTLVGCIGMFKIAPNEYLFLTIHSLSLLNVKPFAPINLLIMVWSAGLLSAVKCVPVAV